MKYFIYILTFLFSFNSYSQEIVRVSTFNGDNLNVFLPSGFCSINDNPRGIFMLNHLNSTLASMNMSVKVKIVYKLCDSLEQSYPWGFIAIEDKILPISFTQKEYNIELLELMEKDEYSLNTEDINKAHENRDIDIKLGESTSEKVVWYDENSFITYASGPVIVENKTVNEVFITSLFINKQYVFQNIVFELYGEHDVLKSSKLLLDANILTKQN
jgi:hypothetical protein